ncbi:MAG: tetratricopeptide repeat protein [Gammaproteobacteria bacterium]|nr:tetratricopeptide repeat protein [Gammaproteobacteria bacterium]
MKIGILFNRLMSVILAVSLAACSSMAQKKEPSSAIKKNSASKTVATKARDAYSLSPDVIYNILVGEIALQRRNLDLAYAHQLKGADLAQDAVAAERAARIALHQKDQAGALVAVKRWITYAPEDAQARQMAVMLNMQSEAYVEALRQLRSMVQLYEQQGQDGFVHAVTAVTAGQDRPLALRLIQSLADGYKDKPEASYAVALSAVMARDFAVAEHAVRQAIRQKSDMDQAYALLSRIYMERKDSAGAMRVMQQALDISPDSAALRSAYARLLVDLDRPELAYSQFQKLYVMMPDNANILFSLGIISLQLDRRTQAAEHFTALIKTGKRVVGASFYLGRIDELEGRPDAAIAWYAKVKNGSYLFDAMVRAAGLMAEKGDVQKARSMLNDVRTKMPGRSVDLFILEGEILRKHSANDQVVELYSAALKQHPDDVDLLYARALSASLDGRVDILEQDILSILERKPDHADAMNALGYTLADQTDRYQEALDYITKAMAIKPDSPAILDSMGWVQYRMGNNEQALKYLRRAFSMQQDVEIAAHLGELLWVTGQKQEAQKILQGALKNSPDNKYLQQAIKRLGI